MGQGGGDPRGDKYNPVQLLAMGRMTQARAVHQSNMAIGGQPSDVSVCISMA